MYIIHYFRFSTRELVSLGIHNKTDPDCTTDNCIYPQQDFKVEEISQHRLYQNNGGEFDQYDIGLIRLDHDVNISISTVRPICLMEKAIPMPAKKFYSVIGWGYTSNILIYFKNKNI